MALIWPLSDAALPESLLSRRLFSPALTGPLRWSDPLRRPGEEGSYSACFLTTVARSSTSAVERWTYWAAVTSDDKLSWRKERGNKMCKIEVEVMRSVEWFFIIFIPFHLTWRAWVCTHTLLLKYHQVWILLSSDSLYSVFEANSILVIERND